jgi:hypothetical protein
MSVHATSWAWQVPDLDREELLVLLCLADHANEEGVCWPSLPLIARRARMHRITATRVVDRLVELGVIARLERGGGRKSTRYKLMMFAAPRYPVEPTTIDTPERPSATVVPLFGDCPHPLQRATAPVAPGSRSTNGEQLQRATAPRASGATAGRASGATGTINNRDEPSARTSELPIEEPDPERFRLSEAERQAGLDRVEQLRRQLDARATHVGTHALEVDR